MAIAIADEATDREAWLEARTHGEGATDAARIMLAGAQGLASLRREKQNGGSGFRGNAYTRYGNDREPFIAEFAQRQFGLEPNAVLFAREPGSRDLATPDAVSLSYVELGEFKTTVHDWPTRDDIPRRYWWQMVWQWWVMGAKRTFFVFEPHRNFIPIHDEPRFFIFERDEDAVAELVAAVESYRSAEFREPTALELRLEELGAELAIWQEPADAANAEVKRLEAEIRALLVEHGQPVKYEGASVNVSWAYPKPSRRFDAKAFEAQYPRAYERFKTTSAASPRLSITGRN